ncbi:gluconate kinase [Alteromonas alba]|uniref:Gluconokinase n=1 Tax=Alteromonas alba TaxID=2079529 RepID=A0A2S9V6Q5_9ALTE|nr:gluconokinase [Alteromonas alba]PRO72104.1 gluconate kinase [Alteromonas alba]
MTALDNNPAPCCIIVMGVSGSGKSTVGERLAEAVGARFIDGDDLHPLANIAKMSRGEALNDEDRAPWLKQIAATAEQHVTAGNTVVIVCSALKKHYRDIFREHISCVRFIFLDGRFELIKRRMEARQAHFMKAEMLASQFNTLERPAADEQDVYTLDIELPIEQLVADIQRHHLLLTPPD